MPNDNMRENFPSNSRKRRDGPPRERRPGLEKIIDGPVRIKKKGFLKRILDNFLEEDIGSVSSYVFTDILVPAAKSMVLDMINGGAERMLGEDRYRRTRRDGRAYSPYGSFFRTADNRNRDRDRDQDISKRGRARHDFGEIIFETKEEAREVLYHLVDLTIDYRQARVSDLYSFVGIESTHVDDTFGWEDLQGTSIIKLRGNEGYVIDLPKPRYLD